MTNEQAERRIDQAVIALGEHWEGVGVAIQVLVTWNEGGVTKCCARGGGNVYARQGMAREWLKLDEAQELARRIGEELKRPPDESDGWMAQQ